MKDKEIDIEDICWELNLRRFVFFLRADELMRRNKSVISIVFKKCINMTSYYISDFPEFG